MAAAGSADEAPSAGRHQLLSAITRALALLASARDADAALTESFDHAARAFAAEKALLLRVSGEPPLLQGLRVQGLGEAEVEACLEGRSVPGVSASRIRRALDAGEVQLVENSQFEGKGAGETTSLRARPHAVLCAPVVDPWTRAPLAVVYFQTTPGPRGYTAADVPFLQAYATALGHAFGLFRADEGRYRSLEAKLRQGAPEIIGESEETARLREELHETYLPATEARPPRPVLVVGPTGSGKDLVARYLHFYSPARSAHAFVEYNCAGLSGDLVASTLFGHARGAFTGATDAAPGLFRAAHRGTLFLDEIGQMPARGQELLLKVLDHWTVQPLGETKTHVVDLQLVLASNQDLAAAVSEGRFRADLFHRVKALTLRLSPLAARPGDIRPLLTHFLADAERALRKRTRGLAPDALRALLACSWPGNVRELAGVCAALVTHARAGAEISLADVRRHAPDVLAAPATGARFAEEATAGSFADARGRFERELLLRRLEQFHWNVPEAARSLSLSAATLYRYLQRHGLKQP